MATNQGSVRFKGTFTGVTSPNLWVQVDFNNDGDYLDSGENTTIPLSGPTFDYTYSIKAGLFDYLFILRDGYNFLNDNFGNLAGADNVVAGDAYFITGQSNAEAKPVIAADQNLANFDAGSAINFVRVYGGGIGTPVWGLGDGNKAYNADWATGQFGMRIGSRIVAEQGIPVCIMNGAELGHQIAYFQKDYPVDPNPTVVDPNTGLTVPNPNYLTNNYGRELTRLTNAGLQNAIRAVIWFQGESNTFTYGTENKKLSTAEYITEFNKLYNSWDADLGLADRFYMIQIKPGCDGIADSASDIQEAERLLDDANPRMDIISTGNIQQYDKCHYRYNTGTGTTGIGGYREIGNRVITLIYRDFYNPTNAIPGPNSLSPAPLSAEFTKTLGWPSTIATEITMYFKRPDDDLAVINTTGGDIKSLIRLKGGTYTINSAKIVNLAIPPAKNYALRINFSQDGSQPNPTGLGFVSPEDGSVANLPAIVNNNVSNPGNGIGLINFNNLPIAIGILPADPLNLRISANQGANTLRWEVDDNPKFERFIVERGESANEFSPISQVQDNRNAGTGNYQYIDSKPNTSRNYYRIKAVQRDGKSVYSQVVAVNNRTSTVDGISVYPNPVTDRANVSLTVKNPGMATIQIFDGAGKMISTRKISLLKGNNMFSAGEILDHSAGIYTIRVVTDNEVFNARVIRVK
ncbi:T9SS type A sorting domain-containing protein [Flavihumibacter profundi]|uniref:T9SS type A sorting domain-containing protein n=1 Tax=Flavihumibacter profundi TaxID=2716883 RepID=UPI001CC4FA27|nr:T9SS type A sorting domain-containing protein [Flavihumibacter profundi]MBZ5855761.1 T9SS type A sorting domain-containing protein [Flavihumibacter profundi]